MEVVRLCTEAKKRCIYAVSKELGIDVDWNGLDGLSDEQASKRISQLKRQLGKPNMRPEKENKDTFNQWRFGMVVKILFDKYPYLYLKANPNIFVREAQEIYNLVASAEEVLRSPSVVANQPVEPEVADEILEAINQIREG